MEPQREIRFVEATPEAEGGMRPPNGRAAEAKMRSVLGQFGDARRESDQVGSEDVSLIGCGPRFPDPSPEMKAAPMPAQSSASNRNRIGPRWLTPFTAIIGEVNTRRSKGQRPSSSTIRAMAAPIE